MWLYCGQANKYFNLSDLDIRLPLFKKNLTKWYRGAKANTKVVSVQTVHVNARSVLRFARGDCACCFERALCTVLILLRNIVRAEAPVAGI